MEGKLKRNFKRFFEYRNGIDEIGLISFILSIIFIVLYIYFPTLSFFYFLSIAFFIYFIFRLVSKNVNRRELENEKFCLFFTSPFKRGTKARPYKQKVIKEKKVKVKKEKVKKEKKDKNYLYKTCPYCGKEIKLIKKGAKERLVVCNSCYNEIRFKL